MNHLVLLLFLSPFSTSAAHNSLPRHYTSMFSFGDSLADTGNALIQNATLPVGRPPYGMTYFHHPTGRFSDGRTVVDFLAEAFAIPTLPPSLARGHDFRQGANFAVGGATAVDMAFFKERGMASAILTPSSLSVQVGWFEELKPKLCNTAQGCSVLFNYSLAVIGEIGGNDYNIAFVVGTSLKEVTDTYVPRVIQSITAASERLLKTGVVNLLVTGNIPAGCHTSYLALFPSPNKEDYDRYGCLKRFNKFARHHNGLLVRSLERLRRKYPQAKLMYADYYNNIIRFARDPDRFGFKSGALSACCGGSGSKNNISSTRALCGMPGCKLCHDPSTFVIWDGAHFTDAASHAIATGLLEGPFCCPGRLTYKCHIRWLQHTHPSHLM